jgi:hypothetical protein
VECDFGWLNSAEKLLFSTAALDEAAGKTRSTLMFFSQGLKLGLGFS